MSCIAVPLSDPKNSAVLFPAERSCVLSEEDRITHSLIPRGFCQPTSAYESLNHELDCHSPTSLSNSPLNHNQTTVYSPCYSVNSNYFNQQQQQPNYHPLTPASTSSEHSPQCCSDYSPSLHSSLYSPETPNSNFWLVSLSTLVAEECDWHEWVDGIISEVRGEIRSETIFNQSHKSVTQQAPVNNLLKRKESCACAVPSVSSDCSNSDTADELLPPLFKRAKKYSLSKLSHEQITQRKKEQNRIAAQRYRSRKHQTLEEGRSEISFLEKRNANLRLEIDTMEQEICQLKQMFVSGAEAIKSVS